LDEKVLFKCKKNIETHGGDIWITSVGINLGTEVYILLPLMGRELIYFNLIYFNLI